MVKVDKEKCIGCGTCVAISPECFQLDENNKAEFKTECDINLNLDKINQGKDACPVAAIIIE